MTERPDILSITNGAELRRWYWMKDELIDATRHYSLKTTGGKFQILDRVAHFLDTGETIFPGDAKVKPKSNFDWAKETLTPDTVITDNYKNSQNVRAFFAEHAGENFKFTIGLMDWIKANPGKTLGDAVAAHHALQGDSTPTQIKDHNQFNQYTRDFLADNPALGLDDVRRVWAKKRSLPMADGRHRYDRADLDL